MANRDKPVFFAFYPDDFRGGTDHMTNDEVGCYIRLLMYQFDNGAIPKTTLQRMNLCRITDVGQWNRIWDSIGEKFECIDEQGSLANPRMEGERQDAIKRAGYIEKRRADGKRGAQKRWKKQGSDRDPNGDPIGTPNDKPDPDPDPETPNTSSNQNRAHNAPASGRAVRSSKSKKSKSFVPPTVLEVAAYCSEYCSEQSFSIDAQQFVDYYASIGWKRGRNSIKDWKACVRTWVQKRKQEQAASAPQEPKLAPEIVAYRQKRDLKRAALAKQRDSQNVTRTEGDDS